MYIPLCNYFILEQYIVRRQALNFEQQWEYTVLYGKLPGPRDYLIWLWFHSSQLEPISWDCLSRTLGYPLDNLKFLNYLLKLTSKYQDEDTHLLTRGKKSNMGYYDYKRQQTVQNIPAIIPYW